MSNDQISPQEMLRQQKAIEDVNAAWRQKMKAVAEDIALRRWCVEQAGMPTQDMTAEQILRFLTEPLTDASQT